MILQVPKANDGLHEPKVKHGMREMQTKRPMTGKCYVRYEAFSAVGESSFRPFSQVREATKSVPNERLQILRTTLGTRQTRCRDGMNRS
jgi:hypothetical protein